MKRLALLLVLAACSAAIAADAPDAEKMKAAHALLDAMHVEHQMENSTKAMSQVMAKNLMTRFPNMNSRAAEVFMEETMTATKKYAREPGGFLDVIATFYANEFTLDELQQIRAYYESPAGQHMVEAQGKLIQQALPKVMDGMRDRMPAICGMARTRLLQEKVEGAQQINCPGPVK